MTFCPKCGVENKDNANFCITCGSSLSAGGSINDPNRGYSIQQAKNRDKSPIIAVLLNFFIAWGIGYWYLGIKKVFGLPWYSLIITQFFLGFIMGYLGLSFIVFLLLVINIALAYDVYEKALSKPGFVPIG